MATRKRRLPYSEGTWFAVPLQTSGYAVGVVARLAGNGPVFGYFFGPRHERIPDMSDVLQLRAHNAVLCRQFGDLGFLKGAWPIIGQQPNWKRDDWPLPAFVRTDGISGVIRKTVYSDTLEDGYETICSAEEAADLPEDGLSGYVAAEIRLTKLLDPEGWERQKAATKK